MDDKLKIILESIYDVYKDKDSYRVVTIHDIVEKIAYNYEVKCYDIIYGIDIDQFPGHVALTSSCTSIGVLFSMIHAFNHILYDKINPEMI